MKVAYLAFAFVFALQACGATPAGQDASPVSDVGEATQPGPADPMPAVIEQALADDSRPEADRVLDTMRHPAEVLVFAGIDRGWQVADLSAGSGYYSRVLSTAVGANGHVYAQVPSWAAEQFPDANSALSALASERANMTHIVNEIDSFNQDIDTPLDAVFMVLFYHDTVWSGADRAAMNAAAFEALKPGGVYLVIDHHAATGTGLSHVEDLHRIDAASVLEEVTAAGFVLDRESDMLTNSDDPRTISVFAPDIRRQTDRFIYLFRKP